MKSRLIALVRSVLIWTHLGWLPVRVRGGINRGARWTLFPWTSYWRGTHEPEVQAWFASLPDLTGKVCWDLGAHFGYYSIFLARRVGEAGRVLAFEPSAEPFYRLDHHRKLNHLKNLSVFEVGISDQTGSAIFYNADESASTTAHLAHAGVSEDENVRRTTIRTVRLDDWVAAGQIPPPDVVKMDVEGHAHRALAGATKAISNKFPIMIIGLHSRDEREGVMGLLEPLGYTSTTIDGRPWPSRDFLGDAVFVPPANT